MTTKSTTPLPVKCDWWYGLYALQCLSGRNSQAGCWSIWYRCMCGENVKEWRLLSENGVTNVQEEQRSGRKILSRKIW